MMVLFGVIGGCVITCVFMMALEYVVSERSRPDPTYPPWRIPPPRETENGF